MSNKIEILKLCKSFGSKDILRKASLKVPGGQSTVIIGGSGTGKSVLIKCILGLIQPDSGEIHVDGHQTKDQSKSEFLDKIGMLFQGGALFDSLPVWKNVAFKLLNGKTAISKEDARAIAIEKLRRVGLKHDIADQYPAELSGGMQKRVGLARAIATTPEIIFFDEPTTGLDPIMSGVINELIREIVTEIGATALTITHDMNSVRAIADQVALLHEGSFQWTGSVQELETSKNPYLLQFINGSSDGPIDTIR